VLSPRSKRVIGVGLLVGVGLFFGVAYLLRDTDGPPELDLHYPGSVVIGRSETRVTLGSNASAEEIVAFYRQEVAARGFRMGGGMAGIPTTVELFACAWHLDDKVLRLAFLDKNALERRGQPFPGDHLTPYRWSVLEGTVNDADRPCDILLEGDPPP
jgi:hypothetical protein